MKKLFCLLLTLLFLPVISTGEEAAALSIETPAGAIRPGKAFVLNFTVPAQGSCDLVLRDVAGNFVMDVLSGVSVNAGANQLWWNGTSFGVSPAEGVYQLVLVMDGQEAACTVVIGDHAPYLTSIVPTKHAENRTMTVDFYASVEGLLTLGLWNGNVWSLLENRQIGAGMNQVTWDASGITQDTTALTLTLTDGTGFSSNEEHISVSPADFGLTFETATPAPSEVVLTPMPAPTAEPTDDWDVIIDIDHDEAENCTEKAAVDMISKADKKRAKYYNFYTQKRWGAADSYDLVLNNAKLGAEKAVQIIAEYARAIATD